MRTKAYLVVPILLLLGTCCSWADMSSQTNAVSGEKTLHRLDQIIVPVIDFRGAKVADAVAFLEQAAAECELRTNARTDKIRFVLSTQQKEEIKNEGNGSKVIDEGAWRFASLHSVITNLCNLAEMEFRVERNTVVFVDRKTVRQTDLKQRN